MSLKEVSSFSDVGSAERGKLAVTNFDPADERSVSVTRQSELESTDINKIVARYERAGLPLPTGESRFLDVSDMPDFRTALEQVQRASEYFMTLPAKSRAIFDNDPAIFLDRVNDPGALEQMVEAGIVPKGEIKVLEAPEVVVAREREAQKAESRRKREVERELDREDDRPGGHRHDHNKP